MGWAAHLFPHPLPSVPHVESMPGTPGVVYVHTIVTALGVMMVWILITFYHPPHAHPKAFAFAAFLVW